MLANLIRVVVAVREPAPVSGPDLEGLLGARAKNALGSSDWLQLLKDADKEFYIAGHSLGKWCSPTNREQFKSHITRILTSEGRVTLVMLDPGSPQLDRLQRATSVDYRDRIQTSLVVLGELAARLPDDQRRRLTISALGDDLALPYMLVGNEHRLFTSTYLASSDSDDIPCLQLERSSDAATAIYDDFRRLADAGASPILPEGSAPGRTHHAALNDRLSHFARRWRA
jgi:hypothetical protein